jgi:16S rRNA (adenine1518-N6/adenine1519-N6)-dimethyltransferase
MRSRRHALGQHFLKDQTVVDRILKMSEKRLDASGARSMVEVGPGRMAITYGLAEMASSKGVPLHLVERDRKLEPVLKEGLQGLEADLRFFDAATETMKELINELAASGKGPVLFVSNLPYSASSQILARLCEVREHLGGAVVMMQKELAGRLLARPGDRGCGSFSWLMQSYFKNEGSFDVSPGAFYPPPKVMSTVLDLVPLEKPLLADAAEAAAFETFSKRVFGGRRKMLRNLAEGLDENAWKALGLTGQERPEAISLNQALGLFRALQKL